MKKLFNQKVVPKMAIGSRRSRSGRMCLFLFTSILVHTQQRFVSGTIEIESGQLQTSAAVSPDALSYAMLMKANGKMS